MLPLTELVGESHMWKEDGILFSLSEESEKLLFCRTSQAMAPLGVYCIDC